MRIALTKCHGSGNDFPLVDARALTLGEDAWATIARVLSDRGGPVGSDGLLALTAGDADGNAFGMRMWNADGSEAETCLNGLRCVGRAGLEALALEQASVRLKTSRAMVFRDAPLAPGVTAIREVAGPADPDARGWLLVADREATGERVIPETGSARAFTAVAMPNPHLVTFVDRIDEAELVALGERCEAAPAWLPGRANVSFVEVRGADTIFVRTFERGVGLTDSCGSAMAASAFVACTTGRMAFDTTITVLNAGGFVRASVARDGMVSLTGNATFDYDATIEIDLAVGVASDLQVTRRHDAETAAWAALVASLG